MSKAIGFIKDIIEDCTYLPIWRPSCHDYEREFFHREKHNDFSYIDVYNIPQLEEDSETVCKLKTYLFEFKLDKKDYFRKVIIYDFIDSEIFEIPILNILSRLLNQGYLKVSSKYKDSIRVYLPILQEGEYLKLNQFDNNILKLPINLLARCKYEKL